MICRKRIQQELHVGPRRCGAAQGLESKHTLLVCLCSVLPACQRTPVSLRRGAIKGESNTKIPMAPEWQGPWKNVQPNWFDLGCRSNKICFRGVQNLTLTIAPPVSLGGRGCLEIGSPFAETTLYVHCFSLQYYCGVLFAHSFGRSHHPSICLFIFQYYIQWHLELFLDIWKWELHLKIHYNKISYTFMHT